MTLPLPNSPQPTRRRVLTGALATFSLPLLAACSSSTTAPIIEEENAR